jgi:hypothetical protein
MTMRLWRLPHGRYDVAIGVDRDGDDQADEGIRREELELWRYDGAVRFTARPRETLVIEAALLEQLDDVRSRPDLAIGPGDAVADGGAVTVTVHNVGGSASPASVVEVRSAEGRRLGSAPTPPLPPPHNLQPATARVRVGLDGSQPPAVIVVDPAGRVAEITEANNQAPLPRRHLAGVAAAAQRAGQRNSTPCFVSKS